MNEIRSYIHLPCAGLETNPRKEQIKELLFVTEDNMSVRERRVMEQAGLFGEIYPGVLVEHSDLSFEIWVDLGEPDSVVKVHFPKGVDRMVAAFLTQQVAEGLM